MRSHQEWRINDAIASGTPFPVEKRKKAGGFLRRPLAGQRLNRTTWLPFAPSKVFDPPRCRRDVATAPTVSHEVARPGVLSARDHQGHWVPWLRLDVRPFRLVLAALLR